MLCFDHLKQLHDSELYQDLKQLACIVLTICENTTDSELMTLPQHYQCMVYYGNALYHMSEYAKAEAVYKRALLLRKAINKAKGKTNPTGLQTNDLTCDVEVKYKIYQCLMRMELYKDAMTVLEGIGTKQRNAKINLALAKLYLRSGMDRSAITSYKEVLRECPMALEAINELMSLGLKGSDVHALVMNGLPHGALSDWLAQWIQGHALLHSKEYRNAITIFRLLDNKTSLKDNVYLMTSIAKGLYLDGQHSNALLAFQRAHAIDPLHLKDMDMYAHLLYKEKRVADLQKLANQLLSATEQSPEPWTAMGYHSLESKKAVRAVYFAQKAITIDPQNVDALLMKGNALLEIKRTNEAIMHMTSALRRAPYRFEAYKGLVSCYFAVNRPRDALHWAGKALKTLGGNVRTLTLYGHVIAKQPETLSKPAETMSKAKPYLEKAMKIDPSSLEPVYLYAEILAHEKQHEKGIELLKSYLYNHSTCRLHQMLGDFLTKTGEQQEALEHYCKAVGLDPSNTRAREGIERAEKHGDMNADSTLDVEIEEMDNSDNEAAFDASDVESTWSDTELA